MKLKEYVRERFEREFPDKDFPIFWDEYKNIKPFQINENVEKVGGISEEAHYIMRASAQCHLEECFRAMKIDMNDTNVSGEKGTPYRIIKMWTGSGLNDSTELLSGRWSSKPRLATFPNEHHKKIPITKRVDVVAVCSHHMAPFSTKFRDDAYAVISYIPGTRVLGISKLQRIVDFVARRGWLQEELTMKIYEEISKAAETDSVYVKFYNLVHTCESLRGAQSEDGAFTSEYYGGDFEDPEIRKQVTTK
jgi:GTP cyclohydrolase I